MASLIKVNAKYYLDFSDIARTPKRKRVALRVSTKREAERLKAKLEYEYSVGEVDPWHAAMPVASFEPPVPSVPVLTAHAAAEAFYASRSHKTASTQRTYRDIIGRFVTRRTYTKHLSTYFRFCIKAGAVQEEVTTAVKLRRVPRTFPKALTVAEVAHLVQTIESVPESVH